MATDTTTAFPAVPKPTFTTLPPELRLEIYGHYLASLLSTLPTDLNSSTTAPSDLPIFSPPLLATSQPIYNELSPLHERALTQALRIIEAETAVLEERLQSGKCFEWDCEGGSFYGGFSGSGVWGAWWGVMRTGRGLEGLRVRLVGRLDGRVKA